MIQKPNKMYFQDGLLGQPMYDPNMNYFVDFPFDVEKRLNPYSVRRESEFSSIDYPSIPDVDALGNPIPVMDSMGRNTPVMSEYTDDRINYDAVQNYMNQQTPDLSPRGVNTVQGGRGGPSDPSAYMPPEEMAVEAPDAGGMSGMQVMNLMKALGGMGGGSEQYDFSTAPGIVRGRPMQQMNFGPSYSQGYTGGLLG